MINETPVACVDCKMSYKPDEAFYKRQCRRKQIQQFDIVNGHLEWSGPTITCERERRVSIIDRIFCIDRCGYNGRYFKEKDLSDY